MEYQTKRTTVFEIETGRVAKFRDITVHCKCGKDSVVSVDLIATSEISVKDYRMIRRFVSKKDYFVCQICKSNEMWATSSDAPWGFEPGCEMLFDSENFIFPAPGESRE